MIPARVGRGLHHQQTPVGQLEPDHLHPPGGAFASRVFVPEEEVSAGPKGDGGDGAARSQFSFIISMFPNVVTAIFVPTVRKQAQVKEQPSPEARQHRSSLVSHSVKRCPVCSGSTGESLLTPRIKPTFLAVWPSPTSAHRSYPPFPHCFPPMSMGLSLYRHSKLPLLFLPKVVQLQLALSI